MRERLRVLNLLYFYFGKHMNFTEPNDSLGGFDACKVRSITFSNMKCVSRCTTSDEKVRLLIILM